MIEPRGSVTNTDGARATDAQARKTALLVGGVLLLIAAWNLYRGRTTVLDLRPRPMHAVASGGTCRVAPRPPAVRDAS